MLMDKRCHSSDATSPLDQGRTCGWSSCSGCLSVTIKVPMRSKRPGNTPSSYGTWIAVTLAQLGGAKDNHDDGCVLFQCDLILSLRCPIALVPWVGGYIYILVIPYTPLSHHCYSTSFFITILI